MEKNLKYSLSVCCGLLLLLLLCPSCSDGLPGSDAPFSRTDKNVKFSLAFHRLTAGEAARESATRSTDEGAITNLCVFQFSGSPGTDGILLKQAYFTGLSAGNGSTVEFIPSPSSACFFCICANVGDLTAVFMENSSTYADLAAASLTVSSPDDFSALLPMSGVSATVNTATQSSDIPVELTRLVSKVTFTCDLSQFPAGDTFTITGAWLRGVPASIPYLSPSSGVTSGSASASYAGTGSVDAGAQTTTYVWYLPENLRGTGTTVTRWTQRIAANAPADATYIELTGTYTPDGGTAKTAVYALYLGDGTDVNNYDVVRNRHYIVTSRIKSIDVDDPRMVIN